MAFSNSRTLPGHSTANPEGYHDALLAFKKQLILEAIAKSDGTLTQAARLLGLHPNYLHRLVTNLRTARSGQESFLSAGEFADPRSCPCQTWFAVEIAAKRRQLRKPLSSRNSGLSGCISTGVEV